MMMTVAVTWAWTRTEVRANTPKGGDPATGSPTATLLRLYPSHEAHRGKRLPEG